MQPSILELLFGFEARVDRPTYLKWGFGLMLLKFLGEYLITKLAFGATYSLLAFLLPFANAKAAIFGQATPIFMIFQIVWSLPFMWIAVSMSTRRAADAGVDPCIGLGVLIPGFNYLVMFYLSLQASVVDDSPPMATDVNTPAFEARLGAMLYAIVVGAVVGLAFVTVSTVFGAWYVTILFWGLPTLMGAIASWMLNRERDFGKAASNSAARSAILLGTSFLLLFALEGVLCLVMAIPFALIGAFLGGKLGRYIANRSRGINTTQFTLRTVGLASVFALGAWVEHTVTPIGAPRAVVSEQIIAAPPEVIWKNVIEFSELPAADEWLFKIGIAYPIRARIDGAGVGAIRHCEFSTGPFVEPITVWDPPRQLAFSVISQPATLTELSLYRSLEPRHLSETFRSHRGQFDILPTEEPGKWLLRGTTWYTLDMSPLAYWSLWSDGIIHAIHHRVLGHIKNLSESTN